MKRMLIFILSFCIVLTTGCAKSPEPIQSAAAKTERPAESSLNKSPEPKNPKITENIIPAIETQKELFSGSDKYLTWVPEEWHYGDEKIIFSFGNFTIDHDKLSGQVGFSQGYIPWAHLYKDDQRDGQITGTLQNNKITASLYTSSIEGKIEIGYLEENKLAVRIQCNRKDLFYGDLPLPDGYYICRPYNISDVYQDIEKIYPQTFDLKLEVLGNVRIIPAQYWGYEKTEMDVSHYVDPVPRLFVTNERGDIFYVIYAFSEAIEIVNIEARDLNEDGLIDLFIKTRELSESSMAEDWYFYQDEMGILSFHHVDSEYDQG